PDQRLTAVSFAMAAASVADGSITATKIAPGALQASSLSGTLAAAQIPGLDAAKITSGTLAAARLPTTVALKTPDLQNATNALGAQITGLQTQVTALKAQVSALGGGSTVAGGVLVSPVASDAALQSLGYVSFTSIGAPPWVNGSSADAPSARF